MYFPAYLWKPRIINFILSVSFLTHDYRRVGFHFCHSFFESSCVILTVLLRVGTILCTRCSIYTSSTSSCHCVKSVGIRSYCGPYSVRMQEYTDQNNSEYEYFSRSVCLKKYFGIFQLLLKENVFAKLWLTPKGNLLAQEGWPMRWRYCINLDLEIYSWSCIKTKFYLEISGTCERSSGDLF